MRYIVFTFLIAIITFSCQSDYQTESVMIPEDALVLEQDIEIEPPRTAEPPPPPTIEEMGGIDNSDSQRQLAYNDQNSQNSNQQANSSKKRSQQKRGKRKVIRKAKLEIEIADYQKDMQTIRAIAEEFAAEITSESQRNSSYKLRNYIVLRLSPNNLDGFVARLEKVAKVVVNKQISANDVTKRYNDFTTRLQVREATIQRYQEILRQAKNVPEILQVERELRKAIEERDALKGELKYLNDRVALSTVELEVYQNIEYAAQQRGFFSRLGDAISDGWQGFLGFVIGLVAAWPFVLLGSLLVVLFIRYRRERKRKTASSRVR